VKGLSSGIIHKSDTGLVALNLSTPSEVAEAVAGMVRLSPEIGEFIVERMVLNPVAEIIVGLRRNRIFGSVLVIGFGGIFAEILRDTQALILPVVADDVRRAIKKLRGYPLLSGVRGRPRADIDALVSAILCISSAFSRTECSLAEIEANPILVMPIDRGVVAVDVVATL
jgi:succinyl-CoA synthetase beta subunit